MDWQDGSVLSPRDQEFHQHFNPGAAPVQYFAFRLGAADSHRWGGVLQPYQIESEDEDPAIYERFARECAANGVAVAVPQPNYRGR